MKNYILKGIKKIFPKKNAAQNHLGSQDIAASTRVAEKSFMLMARIMTYFLHLECP